MQALKLIGILIMLSVLAATAYVFTQEGVVGANGEPIVPMSFLEFTTYAVPAFCFGAVMLGIERLTSKIATAQANKPAKPDKKEAPKKEEKGKK